MASPAFRPPSSVLPITHHRSPITRLRVRDELGDFLDALHASGEREDPLALAAQIAAAEKRLCYLRALAASGSGELSVWGDDGWSALEGSGARQRGYAGHRHELTRIYASAGINVDIGRLYQSDIVTLRVFEVLACQGFLLAEHGPTDQRAAGIADRLGNAARALPACRRTRGRGAISRHCDARRGPRRPAVCEILHRRKR